MKKLLIWAMVLTSIICFSCTKSEDNEQGSIYGIVTKLGTAEPMKAVGVELYKKSTSSPKDALLLKTVTFDDGHFEFKDLNPDYYQVKVVADGYEQLEEGSVAVEAGRQARIDLQVRKPDTHLFVRTLDATEKGNSVTLNGECTKELGYDPYEIGFVYANQNISIDDGTLVKCNVATSFSTTLTGLANGPYHYRAYAKNSIGIAYGEICSFVIFDNVIIGNLMIQTDDLGYGEEVNWYDADKLCKESRVAGYSDWRLPTTDEMKIMYRSKNKIPNLKTDGRYWSSDFATDEWYVEYEYMWAYYTLNFGYEEFGGFNRSHPSRESCYVRAVRTIN